jgi:hypothetical protein
MPERANQPPFISAEVCYCVDPEGEVQGRCRLCGGRILDDPEDASDY